MRVLLREDSYSDRGGDMAGLPPLFSALFDLSLEDWVTYLALASLLVIYLDWHDYI